MAQSPDNEIQDIVIRDTIVFKDGDDRVLNVVTHLPRNAIPSFVRGYAKDADRGSTAASVLGNMSWDASNLGT